ncbi:LysR family transcriptional regulator [Burkholderia lata]|uniref:LysR family transcriptional regulator n=1 Tax=Burkholderia lata (strain ATCC 17760 / DSM 23089 / LMG 22485 / NCIMB 9086 / R18194 / 383) TaxID=482957 RepID=A0A6P2LDL4_BURL3|nr:LysR family transcriptional regulator [Burkholderia lata]VWB69257.1 LysR family transcriptional regulator [Burkholderia lata]VWC65699.1 LysR family transcriptional regulator [Burkholderia lata]VWD03748.1 LysR family transcriptional regulator [Burkholderia lata]
MNNLARVDLNLLVTLHALLSEKHISRTAVRLHRSQPAVSHALARLREIFGDPLLVRRAGRLELTARANELVEPLNDVLGRLGALIEPPAFDPSAATRVFRIAMSDYGARIVLPALVKTLRADAPGIELIVSQATREAMRMQLMDGEVDLALGVLPALQRDLHAQPLFVESFACVADASRLPRRGELALDAWLARPHALVAMRDGMDNEVDRALARLRRERHIAVILPFWGVANDLIAGTDLVLTVARRNLDRVRDDARLRVFEPPFPIDSFEFAQHWHARRHGDAAHIWLRQTIARVASGG